MNIRRLSTLGLVFITFLSAIQYIFLKNVPDSVSTFAFLCVTNILGFVILGTVRMKEFKGLKLRTVAKGALLAAELTGFNFFMLLGARNLDAVVTSSVVSMYFLFVTPILILLRKKVNFFSSVATVIATIALLLMFGADTDALFSSAEVLYLILADIFFATYVVSISVLGENEDSTKLTLSQIGCAIVFSFACWFVEAKLGQTELALPTQQAFWVSAVFIGVFIRAIYGIVQISCQKHVSAISASLIFSAEIIITMILDPFLSRVFGTEYTGVTIYQIVGCILFIIATLLVDDLIMSKFGYDHMDVEIIRNADGSYTKRSSVSRKMVFTTLLFSMCALILSTVICLTAIYSIRDTSVKNSTSLGQEAAASSRDALLKELENELTQIAENKARLAQEKLNHYASAAEMAARYAETLYANPDDYAEKEVMYPLMENDGVWAMQRCLAGEELPYEAVERENKLLGNMLAVFEPIVNENANVATIYIGSRSGILVSYDKNSGSGYTGGEAYWEFRDSEWFKNSRTTEKHGFTATYFDSYGRGLTITCYAPFFDKSGEFIGCVAMDVLMEDLNNSMVNDGIIDPSVATMIDSSGNIIASKYIDPASEETLNIFDGRTDTYLSTIGREILENKNGIVSTGKDSGSIYVAYATVKSTDWTLCIQSPVAMIIEPAVRIHDDIDSNTETMVVTIVDGIRAVVQNCLVLSAFILLFITFMVGKAAKRISDPLITLEKDVQKISGGDLTLRTDVSTDDEIGNLARSFNSMTESLEKHIEDLKEATAKAERISYELAVATNIQSNMLPAEFPAFPNHPEIDLYATMTPAKEVGGDFYDFFEIDDSHVGFVMADVSGKGVPAALFMMISMTLIRNEAKSNLSPAAVLSTVNKQLCERNKEEMFVTVWLGIMDTATGTITAANAGHEYPVICKNGGGFELIKDRHGFVLAGMEMSRYREYEIQMDKGDILYLYTDGVPEATNSQNELFGNERMLASLNAHARDPRALIDGIKADTAAFVAGADQFDDMTMMAIKRL